MTTQKPTIDLAGLRAKAEAATPGPWENDYGSVTTTAGDNVVGFEEKGIGYSSYRCLVMSRANGDYIAAANPLVVLSLLNSLEAVRVAVERAKADSCDFSSHALLKRLIEELEKV